MSWKIAIWQLLLGLFWVWVIDEFVFPNEKLFLIIAAFLFIIIPLVSFLYRLINTVLTRLVMGRAIDEQAYQGWIDANLPPVDPEDYCTLQQKNT